MKNAFQAVKDLSYPVIPATWPNRAVRRSIQYGRALSQEWAAFFMQRPDLKKFIKTGRMPAVG